MKAHDERPRRRGISGYPPRTTPGEVKGRAISSEALLVAAILLSAALLLVTFLEPAAKRAFVPDEGSGRPSLPSGRSIMGLDKGQ